MSIEFHGRSKKVGLFIYYSYIHDELQNLGGVVLLTLCTRIIVHPNIQDIIHLNIIDLFIVELSMKIPTLFIIFLIFLLALFMLTMFIIYSSVSSS